METEVDPARPPAVWSRETSQRATVGPRGGRSTFVWSGWGGDPHLQGRTTTLCTFYSHSYNTPTPTPFYYYHEGYETGKFILAQVELAESNGLETELRNVIISLGGSVVPEEDEDNLVEDKDEDEDEDED